MMTDKPDAIRSAELAALPGIAHGFFTRAGGVSEGLYLGLNCGRGSNDDRLAVAENRRRVATQLDPSAIDVVTLYQVHGSTALAVSGSVDPDALPKADGVVTATPNLVIGVLTADCAPVLFADPAARVVGAAHAGWRGAVSGITDSTIAAMETLGAQRNRIVAAVGPSISQAAYEVGKEFENEVIALDPANTRFFTSGASKARFDLPGYVLERLRSAGVSATATGHCTYAHESLFFSFRRTTHRAEGDYGRQISAIVVT